MQESKHTLGPDRETGYHRKHTAQDQKKRMMKRGLIYGLIIILCGVAWWQITVRGYTLAKNYIDQSVQSVRQDNAVSVQELQDRIDTLSRDMDQLRESLDSAGGSISNSATVQERIDEKLENLDKQLQDLEKSLKILKEAP